MLGLGRPASQLSSSSYLDSFSQSTSGNNQLLRPLSVTPSILEPPESPWPLQSSTPSPAWSGSIGNQMCTEEMSQQLPNISSSVHFSTSTRATASIIPTVSTNTSLSSRALNNRPIGADVLLSSSSSAASEIQEQMSQSQRQKSLLEPNLGLPTREDNVRTSLFPNAHLARHKTMPVKFSVSEPIPSSQQLSSLFKPPKQTILNKPMLIHAPVQVPVTREFVSVGVSNNRLDPSAVGISDIKTLPIQPSCTIKLIDEGPPLPSNQLNLHPISQAPRQENILKQVNIMANNEHSFSLPPSSLNNIQKAQKPLNSSLQLPLLPINVPSSANYNTPNNSALLGSLQLVSNSGVPFPVTTPSTGMFNVVQTVPIMPEAGLTIFPSVNTPKMSLITLESSNKNMTDQTDSVQCDPRPPLRRILKQDTADQIVVGSISTSAPFQTQIPGGKMASFENVEILQGQSVNPEQNMRVLLQDDVSLVNPNQNRSNVKFVQAVDDIGSKQGINSSTGSGKMKLWQDIPSVGVLKFDTGRNTISAPKSENIGTMGVDAEMKRQINSNLIRDATVASINTIKIPENFSTPLNIQQTGQSGHLITSVIEQPNSGKIHERCQTRAESVLGTLGHPVHILSSNQPKAQNNLLQTLISTQDTAHKGKHLNDESISISIHPQKLPEFGKGSVGIELVENLEAQNLVKSNKYHLSDEYRKYVGSIDTNDVVKWPNHGTNIISSTSKGKVVRSKNKYVQTIRDTTHHAQMNYTESEEDNAQTYMDKCLQNIDKQKRHDGRPYDVSKGRQEKEEDAILKLMKNSNESNSANLNASRGNKQGKQPDPNDRHVERVVCSKCRICGYLTTSTKSIDLHLEAEHLDLLEASVLSSSASTDCASSNWTDIAQKHQIPLRCSLCMNTFQGTHLSFKVHLMDDHALGEEETNSYFQTQNEKRRLETVEAVKKRRRDVEKYKKNKREILEAYVDKKGELRVRTVQRYVEHDRGNKTVCDMKEEDTMKEYLYDTEENVDVSAKEYIDVVTVVKCNTQGSPDVNQEKEKAGTNEKEKRLIHLTQSSFKNPSEKKAPKRGLRQGHNISKFNRLTEDGSEKRSRLARNDLIGDKDSLKTTSTLQPICSGSEKVKRNVGRPKGSRSIGLTKLKRLNPQIQIHENEIGGIECGIEGCAVRLKEQVKLSYHRKCHQDVTESINATIYQCPECRKEAENKDNARGRAEPLEVYQSETWKRMSLHLWRSHKVDMELYSCDVCNEFKEFTLWRLDAHKTTHQVARPFLCNECGKCFKTKRNLKLHSQLHQEKKESPTESGLKTKEPKDVNSSKGGVCEVCKKGFTTKRFLRHHEETVHQGLKPYMCNFCG